MNYKGVKIPEPKNYVFRFEYAITEKSKVEALESLRAEPIMLTAEDFKFVGTKKPSKQDKELYIFGEKDFINFCIAENKSKGRIARIAEKTSKKRGKKN